MMIIIIIINIICLSSLPFTFSSLSTRVCLSTFEDALPSTARMFNLTNSTNDKADTC